ncbi:Hsp20/alpha crystallin family protein [Poriferisphaera sp. WC338]|uniref:Hsp20/alpha crystallin family protein n=1 Tax=Poriferisphaera sp. WC338 TaxID=3425129 RepID=UPI003D816539
MLPSIKKTWETPLETFSREMSRFFGDEHSHHQLFAVDIYEKDNAITLEAELPGFSKDEIEVTTEQNTLTIKAEHKEDHEDREHKRGKQHISERRYTSLTRSFDFPGSVDASKVEAKLEKGILHLKLPKREEVHSRKIDVK